jgi:hypothetical protein|tara:strand:- start:333 stop:1100 length:768 start_codon:yes stop_codon:yes gene_type:complete
MKKTRAKICNFLLLLLLFGPFALAQTIINTENMMIDDQGKLSYAMSFQGDLNFGNIDLIQFSTAQQLSKSVDKHLFRLLLNYDYIKESGTEISSDYTGQIRYNYRINKNSFFAFLQAQNIKSLRMNHRYTSGGGYRHRMIQKEDNFWDLSAGLFFEDELYDNNLSTQNQVYNWRYSLSTFLKHKFSEKLFINLSLYYQINTSNTKDYRLFLEPRIYYTLEKFNIFLDWTHRFHSTPYIDVFRTDNSLNVGIEFNL